MERVVQGYVTMATGQEPWLQVEGRSQQDKYPILTFLPPADLMLCPPLYEANQRPCQPLGKAQSRVEQEEGELRGK